MMTKKILYPILIAPVLLLTGCGGKSPFRVGGMVEPEVLIGNNVATHQTASTNNSAAKADNNGETEWQTKKTKYKVQKGDTLYGLSRKFGIGVNDLAKMNNISTKSKLKLGQNLVIVKQVRVAKGDSDITPPAPPEKVEQTASKVEQTASIGTGTSSGRFIWPVNNGRIIKPFGGQENPDGMAVQSSPNSLVVAADGGKVIYVGNDLKHLGMLVLVKHNNGFITAYGYLQKPLVANNDKVDKGQAIATVGQTNNGSALYFEIRRNNKPVNPLQYLPR